MAQTEDVLPGDFYQLVQQDLQVLGGGISDRYIQETSRSSFKKEIKMKTRLKSKVFSLESLCL